MKLGKLIVDDVCSRQEILGPKRRNKRITLMKLYTLTYILNLCRE